MRDGVRAARMVAWPHQSSTRVCCTREIDPLWLLSDAVWRLMCARHASFHIGGALPCARISLSGLPETTA